MSINAPLFRRATLCAAAILALPVATPVFSATLSAGPGKTYSTPCRALTVAADGDTVEIDGSSYDGDVCVIRASNLTIRGVNGRPKINANGQNAVGKGTWVLYGANTTIDNVELSGAAVPDQNGAALRLDAPNLTLRNSYIHHNENGILTDSNPQSNVVIENSEFSDNGRGNGYTHNLYIGNINSLVFRGSYSHDANVGHNLKSRARTNTIMYSRFSASYNQPSYEIDLPNAGTSYIIGNVIQQPSANQAATMIGYGWEGASNPGRDLYVVNNTFLNDDSVRGTFVSVADGVGTPVLMQNNVFSGTGSASNQSNAIDRNNYRSLSPAFLNRGGFDLHPAGGSPMINAGAALGGAASGLSLTPTEQYKFPVGTESRPSNGIIDIGAYEATGLVSSVVVAVPAVTAPVVAAVAPALAAAPASADGWTGCAGEGGNCSFSGTRQVRYGANDAYSYRTATGSILCNNGTFGDPAYGLPKSCSYAAATTTAEAPAPAPTSSWTACAAENGSCSFSGTRQVRYGANGVYVYKTATGPISCSNSTFGDPIVGVVKLCSVSA
jgi:hypothetical protein